LYACVLHTLILFLMSPTTLLLRLASLVAAVLAQTHESISEATVEEMVDKYSSPVREFPDEWDTALLNVYRADFNAKDLVKGRKLLESAKERRKKIMVVTGDEDNVVPVRASTRVASLLDVELDVIEKCGHLPMDERPEELARMMIDFINDNKKILQKNGLLSFSFCKNNPPPPHPTPPPPSPLTPHPYPIVFLQFKKKFKKAPC
jgi:pimeloyl-ACP methyl ester carboxylesterase